MGDIPAKPEALSRRERQVMDIVYQAGDLSAAEVRAAMGDPPSYSAVRALLGVLEGKGHLNHRVEGTRYVYCATRDRAQASQAALTHVVHTFFEGSAAKAAVALLQADTQLSAAELAALKTLVEAARKEGR